MSDLLLADLFTSFIRERKFISNVSPKTVRFLNQSWKAFTRSVPGIFSASQLSNAALNEFVIKLRESGIKPTSVNTYIRGVNCFLTWMSEDERKLLPSPLRIKQLRVASTLPPNVDDGNLAKLVAYRGGECHGQRRVHAAVMMVIDTGVRINEVIGLKTNAVDLDNLSMLVVGKGNRERLVPFSPDLRRVVVRYRRDVKVESEFFFSTASGRMMSYRNLYRDYAIMLDALGIVGCNGFHRLRHTFASNFMRFGGGNQFHLKQILGHTTLKTTDIYVHANVDGLRRSHNLAGLSRLTRGSGPR